ncbi:MAG: hypothetical protein IPL63_11005 [Saprospiraceae bacterium]|nr:hypothetical protein [Saprospiraceae bacterium]
MEFLSNIRRLLFMISDKLTGSVVFKNVKEINDFLNSDSNNNHQLIRLLQHATATVPNYKTKDLVSGIQDFPVINKSIIKSNISVFLSEKYKKENLLSLTTSGSTGTPFTVFQDILKKKRNTADTIVFADKAGYRIGEKNYTT